MTFRFAFKTSFGHLEDVLTRCLACLGKTSLRHLIDVFLPTWKTSIYFRINSKLKKWIRNKNLKRDTVINEVKRTEQEKCFSGAMLMIGREGRAATLSFFIETNVRRVTNST